MKKHTTSINLAIELLKENGFKIAMCQCGEGEYLKLDWHCNGQKLYFKCKECNERDRAHQ